ncbi:ATP-binding protein [Agarivorans sp. Alg241-V36]|uniref:sensor histidine kinase n=1 Tax=Agarivorans sp. Alg241-V36 TaxID=2305992 RepID=UPI0013D5D59C|nr:ATP-binding protein [Agarivorans sp. Alg241-V36]
MKFEDWSLSKKLSLNFLLYFISFCLFMGASLSGFNFIKNQFDEVAKDSVPDIVAILELKSVSKRLFAEIQGFIATGDMDEAEEFHESVELFDVWLERWDIHAQDSAERGLKREMLEHKQTFENYANNIFKLAAEQQQLIERFEQLHDNQAEGLWGPSVDNQLNYFFRLTYLTILSSSEEEDHDDDESTPQSDHEEDIDEQGIDGEERLEEASEALIAIAAELENATDAERVREIVDVASLLIQINEEISEYLELVEDYEEQILDTLDLAVELQNSEVEQAFLSVNKSVKTFVVFISFMGFIGLALSFYVYKQIRQSVSNRLAGLVYSTQIIANGDLEHETKIYGSDEFGQLSNNFNQMTSTLRQTTVSKDYVDNLLASMTESLIVASSAGVIEVVNDEALAASNYRREELIGQHLSLLLPNIDELFERTANSSNKKYRTECSYVAKSGALLPVMLSSSQLLNASGEASGIICVASDIQQLKHAQTELEQSNAELKTTQSQLIQTSKLASIGELSAGVAHELNQPLMIIRNGGQLLERRINKGTLDDEKLHKFVGSVLSNSKRMMKIIDHLRTFSRHSSTEFIEVDVNSVVNNSILMVGEQLKLRGISITVQLSDTALWVKGDANQLEQVLLNLISNARDAMNTSSSDNKLLTLATRLTEDEQGVEIEVSDNGDGIPVDVQSRMFDPFYTTKEEGKGTGLGLSISYGIVSDHKGSIKVLSDSDSGTRMYVCLPLVKTSSLQG